MTKALHYLCLILLGGTVIAYVLPLINTRQDWLFVIFALSLIGAIVTRLILDGKKEPYEQP